MTARQERRAEHFGAQLERARAHLRAAREAAAVRAEIDKSDLPDGAKTALGILVDPIGFTHDKIRELAEKEGRHGS